jgi:hypothetical protein
MLHYSTIIASQEVTYHGCLPSVSGAARGPTENSNEEKGENGFSFFSSSQLPGGTRKKGERSIAMTLGRPGRHRGGHSIGWLFLVLY